MLDKDLIGLLSVFLIVVASGPYLWKIFQGSVKPHIFTWVIWSTTTGIAAAARTSAHAGPGAWTQWAAALSCALVVVFSFSRGEHNIARSDVVAFVSALAAIPAWLLTHDPLIAVVIVTAIDLLGYYPTFRKSYSKPNNEAVFNYVISNVNHGLSLIATSEYSLTNFLFPSALFVANTALILFILWRRRLGEA